MTRFDLCCGGVEAIDDIIRATYAVDISKALDPSNPDDFVRIVANLSRSIMRSTRATEAEILRKAINELDVDWASMTPAQRGRVVAAANTALEAIPAQIMPVVEKRLEVSASRTIRGTRTSVQATINSSLSTSLSLGDKEMVGHMTRNETLYITDEYARRRLAYSRQARAIVANGLEQGLGRDAIATTLHEVLGVKPGLRQSRNYWNVISAAFTNRTRTYGHLASYSQSGIERYLIEAVLDESTSEQCRFLHNKEFTVSKGLSLYSAAQELSNPEQIKELMPWPRTRRNEDGETDIFIRRGGEDTTLATVTRSGMGEADDVGEHKNALPAETLDSLGVGLPPYHGLCRTTVVPLI